MLVYDENMPVFFVVVWVHCVWNVTYQVYIVCANQIHYIILCGWLLSANKEQGSFILRVPIYADVHLYYLSYDVAYYTFLSRLW